MPPLSPDKTLAWQMATVSTGSVWPAARAVGGTTRRPPGVSAPPLSAMRGATRYRHRSVSTPPVTTTPVVGSAASDKTSPVCPCRRSECCVVNERRRAASSPGTKATTDSESAASSRAPSMSPTVLNEHLPVVAEYNATVASAYTTTSESLATSGAARHTLTTAERTRGKRTRGCASLPSTVNRRMTPDSPATRTDPSSSARTAVTGSWTATVTDARTTAAPSATSAPAATTTRAFFFPFFFPLTTVPSPLSAAAGSLSSGHTQKTASEPPLTNVAPSPRTSNDVIADEWPARAATNRKFGEDSDGARKRRMVPAESPAASKRNPSFMCTADSGAGHEVDDSTRVDRVMSNTMQRRSAPPVARRVDEQEAKVAVCATMTAPE
mmetsp:Transcript_4737/g.15309  ORF Transcript_4737/g.15309 Transcript_4737/m.15309 type:complete len:382 (+) Transcript_4737:647-1792(+)